MGGALVQECHLRGGETPAPAGVFIQIQPFGQPQLHEQEILRVAHAFRLLGGGAVNEPLYVVRPEPPRPPQAAVGRRADAGIVPAVPIEKIVPPLMAGRAKLLISYCRYPAPASRCTAYR